MDELISIITPTFRRGNHFLSRSIYSVLNQTYQKWELLIVDDNKNEEIDQYNIKEYVKKFNDDRIKVVSNEGNYGANYARNNGIKNANGKYIAFLDDDDEWLPEKLSCQIKLFQNDNPKLGLVYCAAELINDKRDSQLVKMKHLSGNLYENLLFGNFIGSTSFVMIKKSVFKKVGYFSEHLPSNQDWELYLRISKEYEIDSVKKVLVRYHSHDEERISTNFPKKLVGTQYIYNKYVRDINQNKKLDSTFNLKLAIFQLKNRNIKNSIKHVLKASKLSPRIVRDYILWKTRRKGEWF